MPLAKADDQITQATQEQASASLQILTAVGSMNRMTAQVSGATNEQRKGTVPVINSVESINRSARESASATDLIARSANELQTPAARLSEAIAFFKDASPTQGKQLSVAFAASTVRTSSSLLLIAGGRS